MKAIVLRGVNTPFSLQDFENPTPEPGEVLIRLHAAAFNHRDVFIAKGQYAGLKWPIIPGSDGAGVVIAANGDLGQSWVGKEVIFNPGHHWGEDERAQSSRYSITGLPEHGTFAEFIRMPVQNLAPKPAHLNWEQAAALPLAALTAYRALFSRAQLGSGERVLITGIGGGVALMGLQMAVALGCKVWVSSSDESKIARAMELGAEGGVNYRDEQWPQLLKQQAGAFDVVLDGAGGKGFASLVDIAAPGGRIAIYGGTAGKITDLSPQKVFWKQLSILGSTMGSDEDFDAMVAFVDRHQIVPVVDTVFPFVAADEAARRMDAGGQFGKIVLQII